MSRPDRCGSCLHHAPVATMGLAECRRHPPQVVVWNHPEFGLQVEWHFPLTSRNGPGCGDGEQLAPTTIQERIKRDHAGAPDHG